MILSINSICNGKRLTFCGYFKHRCIISGFVQLGGIAYYRYCSALRKQRINRKENNRYYLHCNRRGYVNLFGWIIFIIVICF